MAPAAAKGTPLLGCNLAFSGSYPGGLTQTAVQNRAKALGATTSSTVRSDITHLITTKADFSKKTQKVTKSEELGAHIVDLNWLLECEESGKKVPEQAHALDQAQPPPTNTNGSRKRAGLPTPAPAQSTKKQKSQPAVVITDDEDDQPAKAPTSKAKAPAPALGKSQVARSSNVRVQLDEGCPLGGYGVYIDPNGVIYDASLNQTHASNNNNKFYRIQLLHDGSSNGSSFKVWTRWGRVGDHGQSMILGDGDLNDALKQFESKFKSKSGLAWSARGDQPKLGKYTFVERSYNADSDDEDSDPAPVSSKAAGKQKWEPPKSTLAPNVQKLMELIFNKQFFAATMSELKYDANKLPLGKLSKATITRGFQALKDLNDLINTGNATMHGTTYPEAMEQLSNSYYSLIPHVFGRNRPPVISSLDMLRTEIDLLESLSDMKDAELIMKMDKDVENPVHPLDRQFQGLGLSEMTELQRGAPEFQQLQEYLINTRGQTHGVEYEVESIFRLERGGEFDRFNKSSFAKAAATNRSDRRLLWHGSRCTNFGGILSQGLRIAPPEAPVSGYMFDKGIYLADMSSKSANYCCHHLSNGIALLLLCEAELGKPMQQMVHASYDAAETAKKAGNWSTFGMGMTGPNAWKDARVVHPALAGTLMPDTTSMPGDTGVTGASLIYNEYICYDIAQVRLRYLFRVKMDGGLY